MANIARKVKCQHCKEQFERLDDPLNYVKAVKGFYHKDCYDVFLRERREREDLIAYICEVYKFERLDDVRFLTEIKKYRTEYNYRYAAIKMTLQYAFDIQKLTPDPKYRLGIVKTMYEEAKRYYQQEKDYPSQEKLYTYIKNKFKIDGITKQIDNQLQEFLYVYNYSYEEILNTLVYGFEYENKKTELNYGIGFVPFLHKKAQEHAERKEKIKSSTFEVEHKVVQRTAKEYKPRINQIDMSQFE